jgi:hypothetical protein
MDALLLWLSRNLKLLGVLAILICVATWAIDLGGLVHKCVYCRSQRSVIGVVGVLMLLPDPRQWWVRWPVVALCFFGAHVGSAQIFLIVKSINAGESFGKLNLFMATGALFTLSGQALILFLRGDQRAE